MACQNVALAFPIIPQQPRQSLIRRQQQQRRRHEQPNNLFHPRISKRNKSRSIAQRHQSETTDQDIVRNDPDDPALVNPPLTNALLSGSTAALTTSQSSHSGLRDSLLRTPIQHLNDSIFYPSPSSSLQPPPTPLSSLEEAATKNKTLSEVDVLYGRSFPLVYDPESERFVEQRTLRRRRQRQQHPTDHHHHHQPSKGNFFTKFIAPRLSVAFLPAGVTPNYFNFMRWRVLQRFVNANLMVFGTQSLLMGLGIKEALSSAGHLGAWTAAVKWVLKDALGKIVRMVWASKMGQRFDSDAKRWRFRSSFVFAAGNALEIVTFIYPPLFLVWATLANCCKQISMLTSSSTRTAIYNSFRDGTRENIGDITAKGEAQIAIVELLGIASGVTLSRAIGTGVQAVLATYVCLQMLEIVCMYQQLRCVQYRVLNFERMIQVITKFTEAIDNTLNNANGSQGSTKMESMASIIGSSSNVTTLALLPTPKEVASRERIFLPPKHLSRRAMAFGSLGRTKLTPSELEQLTTIFSKERFLLVVGENVKNPPLSRRRWLAAAPLWRHLRNFNQEQHQHHADEMIQENCHIVLHEEATNVDIVKSTLALTLLRRKLVASGLDPGSVRTQNCIPLIQESMQECDQLFGFLLRQLAKQGWESPARFMFGRVHMRAYWPLSSVKKIVGRNGATQ